MTTLNHVDADAALSRVVEAAERLEHRPLMEAATRLDRVCAACTSGAEREAARLARAGRELAISEGHAEVADAFHEAHRNLVASMLVRHLDVRCRDFYPETLLDTAPDPFDLGQSDVEDMRDLR